MKRLFAIAAVVIAATACRKDDLQPPQAAIETPSATTVRQGETLTIKATVISDLVATVAWSVDGAVVAGATGTTFEFSSETVGEHTVTLTATNDDGIDTDQVKITVAALRPPTVAIEEPAAGTVVAQGETLTLKAAVTSAIDGAMIWWSVDGDDVDGAATDTFTFSSDATGEHTVSVTVKNADGEVSDEISVTVCTLMDFEDVAASYLAGPTSAGENLYHSYGEGQYMGYADAERGVEMMFGDDPWYPGQMNYWAGGVALSRWNDMIVPSNPNQCSVYYKDATTGKGGYGGSQTFAVNFGGGNVSFSDEAAEGTFQYFWVTNNTYAALSMLNGDALAKKFETGDWFKLTISAEDASGAATGTPVEFYLADLRTAVSPGIVTEWSKVDLTPLGNKVHRIKFGFASSDTGDWGMNTPAYFCFDNLAFSLQ